MTRGTIDVETYSEIDLAKAGSLVYATHPSTDCLCVSIFYEDETIRTWKPGDEPLPLPDELTAWNAEFDRAIYNHVLVPKYGWPRVDHQRWSCTMVRSYAINMPGKLDLAAHLWGGPPKDSRGHALMMQLCKPQKPVKASDDPKRLHTPDRLQRLYAYCEQDVRAEAFIDEVMPPLSPAFKRLQAVDRRMNGVGVAVDTELIDAMIEARDAWVEDCKTEFTEITGCESNRGRLFKLWLAGEGITNDEGGPRQGKGEFTADVVRDLRKTDLPAHVDRALFLHQELSKTSLAKLDSMRYATGGDGRLRGMFQLFGAHQTRRYAGRRVQLQNLYKGIFGSDEEVEAAITLVKQGQAHELLTEGQPSVSVVIASLLRACLVAGPGCLLVDRDYSNVEGRIAAWLTGQEWKLEAFRAFDRGEGEDLYLLTYARVYGLDSVENLTKKERNLGKVLDLGGQFGGGKGAYANAHTMYGFEATEDECEAMKVRWREAHPAYVQYWRTLIDAAKATVKTRKTTCAGKLHWEWHDEVGPKGALAMRLPSGNRLWYHQAHIYKGKYGDAIAFWGMNQETHQWSLQSLWHGLAIENACQAISFELMVDALVKCDNQGLPPVLTVHDEIAVEVPADRAQLAYEQMGQIMLDAPAWAEGLPLSSGGWIGPRFKKD